jgi:hypothetical protein
MISTGWGDSEKGIRMPDYAEILNFLAKNPPQLEAERELHASLLELLANCLRNDQQIDGPEYAATLDEQIARSHIDWVHFN